MFAAAPAKVNLFLHVIGRRADGYHLLDSLVVFAAVGDVLRVAPAETLSLAVDGPFAAGLAAEPDNLVLRAARLLAEAAGIAPHGRLVLTKNLPVASGIGGGSADAAAALRLLARHWRLEADGPVRIAPRLGADVPVCLVGRAARMGGIGEVLGPAPHLPEAGLLLVNPGVALSTPAVFRARASGFSAPAALPEGWADAPAMAEDLGRLSNDLEAPAIALCPAVAAVLAALRKLPGCLLARMSGSGATCWGLFAEPGEARRAAEAFAGTGWWSWGGAFATDVDPLASTRYD